jgi:lysophospholipase L1-like esterase
MKRALPWIIAAVFAVAFAASFSELQRMRARFGEVTRHQFHDHQDVRYFIIRAALAGLDRPIVFLGDSITEMAKLPDEIDGHPVVNAGIGGATIAGINAPKLLDGFTPYMVVIALGTNDRDSSKVQQDYSALLVQLKKFTPRLLAIAVSPMAGSAEVNQQIKAITQKEGVSFIEAPLPEGAMLEDGIHLNSVGQKIWVNFIIAAIKNHP